MRKAASEVSGQTVTPRLIKWLIPTLGIASLVLAISVLWPTFQNNNAPASDLTISAPVMEPDPVTDDTGPATIELVTAEMPQPGPDVDQILANYDDATGFDALLSLWGVKFDRKAGPACEQARVQGLSCSYQRGTWTSLKQLDRPVMMTLTGADGENHLVALTGLDDEFAQLSMNDGPKSIPIDTLSDYWFGQFILIWHPANGSDQPIGPGMQHPNVRWLRQSLAVLNEGYQPADIDSESFDDALKVQLMAFQRRNRLEADGVAGQKTQVIINSLMALDGTPRLSASPDKPDGS